MNINIKRPSNTHLVYIIIILALVAWWYFQPNPDPEVIEVPVEVPVRVEVPVVERVFDTIVRPIPVAGKVNEDLAKAYEELKDENAKLQAFKDATRTRTYQETFEDTIQTIEVTSTVSGRLESQTVSYETKPREITTILRDTIRIPVEDKRKFMLGGEVGIPTITGLEANPVFKGNMILENKRGQVFTAGYDTEGRVWFGTAINLFNGKNKRRK